MTTVVITGAAGSIGTKLRRHFGTLTGWRLRPIDRRGDFAAGIIGADLSRYDRQWAEQFAGADAVIHLAGDPYPTASWESVVRFNIDLSLNVLAAVRRHRCPKLIFASSNWVMAGYRFTQERLTTSLPPRPVNAYGSGKLFIERAGLQLARELEISFIALRVGYCQHSPGNVPGPHMEMGTWGQLMWLSDRDLCQGFEKAVRAKLTGGHVLNLMSDNPNMRWDLEETRRLIGYAPEDGHVAVPGDGD